MGMYLQEKLNAFLDKPLVGEVRGKGLIAAIELNTDVNTVNKAAQLCQENGLIVRPVAGTSLALCPPLIISQSQIDEIISILKHSLESTTTKSYSSSEISAANSIANSESKFSIVPT